MIMIGFLPPLELLFLLHRKEVNQNQLQWLHEAVLWLDQLLLPRRFLGFQFHNQRVTIPQDQLEAVQ